MLIRALVAASIVAAVRAAYPTTFPFENESYVPPEIPQSTPGETYDPATDVGGYLFFGPYMLVGFDNNLTQDDFPYVCHDNGFSRYILAVSYGAPPVLPKQTWNCSVEIFGDEDFTGQINSQSICAVGNCCKQYIGLPKYSTDQMEWHSYTENRLSSAMCSDIDEEIYCLSVGGHFEVNCYQYYPSVDERLVMLPCYDFWLRYYLECKVFKSAYTWMLVSEPPSYVDLITTEQAISIDVLTLLQDRLCHPYSYYYPLSSSSESTTEEYGTSSTGNMWTGAAFVSGVLFAL
jgi:hypothetical protein